VYPGLGVARDAGDDEAEAEAPAVYVDEAEHRLLRTRAFLARGAPAEPGVRAPAVVRSAMDGVLASVRRTRAVIQFANELLGQVVAPRREVELGRLLEDTMVTVKVERSRLTVVPDGRQVRWLRVVDVFESPAIEVHTTTWFRIEPGIAFSPLRRPRFSLGLDSSGAQVIRLDDPGYQVAFPALFVSFFWCGTDLREQPWHWANCPGDDTDIDDVDGWADIDWAFWVPTPALGITFNLEKGTPFLMTGVLWNPLPATSIGAGAMFAFDVPRLRSGFAVGDPVLDPTLKDVSSFVTSETEVSWYLVLTLSNDVFERWKGFEVLD
jgi:hypothetical protein